MGAGKGMGNSDGYGGIEECCGKGGGGRCGRRKAETIGKESGT